MATTTTSAREDRLLAGVSRRHNVEGLVANQVLTPIQVVKSTGKIGKYGNEHLRIVHDLVGGMTQYPQITVDTKSNDLYVLEKHGLGVTLSEEEIKNEMQPFDARSDATMDVTEKLMLGRESALASVLTDTAVLTNNETLSGTDQWSDYDNSSPLTQFRTARQSIYGAVGKDIRQPGGFAVVPWDVSEWLSFHPELLDLFKYTSSMGAGLSNEQLKAAMKVDRIIFAMSQYDSSKEGQTASITSVWGKHCVFGYAPTAGRKRMTSLGFTVATNRSHRVFRSRIDDPPNAEKILVDITYDDLITDVGAGYLVENAVA
ncbi:MAG: hypothetical protein RTU92_10895 [Candidatus Thorarchaeota archaeon]